jgi:serine phosphatase RsbU (regulator of sigma subunit)
MFVTEGPLHPESPLFVGRAVELTQMEGWLLNVRCVGAVLGARQTGKTSLLLKLRHVFQGKYAFVYIDLEAVAGAELADCFTYIASEMVSQLESKIGATTFELPTKPNQFLTFLEKCARAIKTVRLVILLDEIGALSPDTSLRLTSAIRAVFTSRHVKPEFARYVFVIAGATDALEVTTGRNSPLKNVAETLYLPDLSENETQQLVVEMFGDTRPAPHTSLFQVLHGWTNGHPYWTQRLAEALHSQALEMTDATVKTTVEQLLRTEDRNLPYVFHALDADRTLRDLTSAMVAGIPISFTRANGAIARLELIGLLKNDRGRCAIRNRIYKEALHREPVRRARLPARDLREFNDRLGGATDMEALLEAATLHLQAIVQNRSVVALAARRDGQSFSVISSVGFAHDAVGGVRVSADSRFVAALTTSVAPANLQLPESEGEWLRRFGTALIVPVELKGSMVAFFCLGPKLSGDDYDAEDRDFLTSLGEQTAAAIDRMRLRALERDVTKAWEIQQDLLPAVLPQVAGFQIAGSCQPARVVSGDYYDVFELNQQTFALCVGDVVGKGMPAALLMANLQATVKALASATITPGKLCEAVNRAIARNVSPGEFITFFYALLDTTSRQIRYTNAGHNPPIVIRGNGQLLRLEEGGPVLGIFPDRRYDDQTVTLGPGDRLLLFTDGVTEAQNSSGEEFGDERLIALVRESADAQGMLLTVLDAIWTFSEGVFHDDVTVLAVTS